MRSSNSVINHRKSTEAGFTLLEVLVVVAISGMLLLSLGNVVGSVSNTRNVVETKTELDREAAFVMRRIVQVISRSSTVILKKNEATEVHYDFSVDPERDINKDGFPEADADKDGLIDEDIKGDMDADGNDDDDGDGLEDEDKVEIIHFKWKEGEFYQEEKIAFDIDGDTSKVDKLKTLISERITTFTVITPVQTGRYAIFQIGLVLTADDGATTTSLNTSVRLGGRL